MPRKYSRRRLSSKRTTKNIPILTLRGTKERPRIFLDFRLLVLDLDERRRREYFLGITSFTSH